MSIYNIIKLSLLLASSAVVACSADVAETEVTNTGSQDTHGLHVYIDPKTGAFLDEPPIADPNSPVLVTDGVAKKKLLVPEYSEVKAATDEAGGSYIEVINPSASDKVFTRRSK